MKTAWTVVVIYFSSMGISPTVSATAWVRPIKGSRVYGNGLISRTHRENTCIFPSLVGFFSTRNISFLPGKKDLLYTIPQLHMFCFRSCTTVSIKTAAMSEMAAWKATKQTASRTRSQAHFTHSASQKL